VRLGGGGVSQLKTEVCQEASAKIALNLFIFRSLSFSFSSTLRSVYFSHHHSQLLFKIAARDDDYYCILWSRE
jgi:hypothetical protein